MIKGFKDFLLRGNVVDLAVAVVIGSAFTAIVTAFTNGLIKPLISTIGGTDAAKGLGYQIFDNNEATFLDFGGVINAAINFVLVAAVVYFVIVLPVARFLRFFERDQAVTERNCPVCDRSISIKARRCPECTSMLVDEEPQGAQVPSQPQPQPQAPRSPMSPP